MNKGVALEKQRTYGYCPMSASKKAPSCKYVRLRGIGSAAGISGAVKLLHKEIVHRLRVVKVHWRRGQDMRTMRTARGGSTHHDVPHEESCTSCRTHFLLGGVVRLTPFRLLDPSSHDRHLKQGSQEPRMTPLSEDTHRRMSLGS